MEIFDKKVKQIKNKRIPLAIFVLIIAFMIFIYAIIQFIPKDIEYVEFNKHEKEGSYARTIVYYLMGPIVQVKNPNDGSMSGYYVAVGKEKNLFIIRLNMENIEIPILGKDIEKDAIDLLEGREVVGNVKLSSSSLKSALNISLNTIFNEEIANNSSYEKVFGAYYLDTIEEVENNAIKLLIVSAFFAIIGALYILINKRIKTNVDINIEQLKLKGKLDEVINEFESGQLINYKKLKVSLSTNYIFSYSVGLDIIDIRDIKEVSTSKKTFGSYDKNKYIIITTKDNIEYYIAPIHKKRQKFIFNELLTKIKSTIQ